MDYGVYFYQRINGMIALTDGLSEEQCRIIQPQLKRLANYDDAKEQIEERIEKLKACSDYPHNFKGQMVEDFEWVLSLLILQN